MQRVEASADISDQSSLAPDVQNLVRTIALWAAERPILSDVVLFGDRLRVGAPRHSPVELAVRYDERYMIEGFDDWIEQLRTNFADLSTALLERVDILTPDQKTPWDAVVHAADIPALAMGKVRIVPTPANASKTMPTEPSPRWSFAWTWAALPHWPTTPGTRSAF